MIQTIYFFQIKPRKFYVRRNENSVNYFEKMYTVIANEFP